MLTWTTNNYYKINYRNTPAECSMLCNGICPRQCPKLVLVVDRPYIATVDAIGRGVVGGVGSNGSVFAMTKVASTVVDISHAQIEATAAATSVAAAAATASS